MMDVNTKLTEVEVDKSDWQLIRLGDVSEEVSKRVDNPANSNYERFVGLEHFASGDLKIREWGRTDNLTSSAKAFNKGDILFARRNAYLRRASQVDFEGCCSGDAFVIREDHRRVVPGYLSIIMNTDALWDFANANAAGTMSKRVKWRDLENYQFFLPPIDQQQDLMFLIQSCEKAIEQSINTIEKLSLFKKTLFKSFIFEEVEHDETFGRYRSKHPVSPLGKVMREVQYGISESLSDSGSVPVLRMNNLKGGELHLEELKYLTPKSDELRKFILNKGDLLFNRTNSYDLVGKVSIFNEDERYSFASYLIRLVVKEEVLLPEYLNVYLNSSIGMAKIRKYRTPGVSQSNINASNLKRVPIPVPTLDEQKILISKIRAIDGAISNSKKHLSNLKAVEKKLINQVF